MPIREVFIFPFWMPILLSTFSGPPDVRSPDDKLGVYLHHNYENIRYLRGFWVVHRREPPFKGKLPIFSFRFLPSRKHHLCSHLCNSIYCLSTTTFPLVQDAQNSGKNIPLHTSCPRIWTHLWIVSWYSLDAWFSWQACAGEQFPKIVTIFVTVSTYMCTSPAHAGPCSVKICAWGHNKPLQITFLPEWQ